MELVYILLLSFLGSIAGLIGGLVFLIKKEWARTLASISIPFAAGVLLSVSLLHLIPEAVHETGETAYLIVLISVITSFVFEQYFAHLHHHEDRGHTMLKTAVPLVIFGDTIHNFIDGVAIAAAYIANPTFGIIVAIATFLHETPHEIGDFGVLISAGWSRVKAFWANFLSAMATFPGALFVYYLMRDAHEKVGVLLAISAGVFLYLGASDFLPQAEESHGHPAWKIIFLVVVGAAVMYFLRVISPAH
jgi:zinc and cadmium transporter